MDQAKRQKAILWGLLSALCFTCLTTTIKLSSAEISIPVIILSRSFLGCLFLVPLVWKKRLHRPQTKTMFLYLLRTFIGFTTIFATYYAYRKLPLHIATSIGYSEPMMQVIISIFVLKATVSRYEWISIVLGGVGAIVIAYEQQDTTASFNIVMLIALLSNLLASVAKGITKRLTQHEPTHQIMFYGYFLNFVAALAFLFLSQPKIPDALPSLSVIALLPLTALLSSISNYAYTQALSMTDIHVLSPVNYTKLLFALPLGLVLFQEVPSWTTLAGSLIIILANYFILSKDKWA